MFAMSALDFGPPTQLPLTDVQKSTMRNIEITAEATVNGLRGEEDEHIILSLAEGVGVEPTRAARPGGFRDRSVTGFRTPLRRALSILPPRVSGGKVAETASAG